MVGGAEDEDCFDVVWFCEVLVGPSSCGSAVVVAGVGGNDGFDLGGGELFFGF
jgi:hypothetical protein